MTQRRLPLAGVVTVPSTRPRNRTAYRRGATAERELLEEFRAVGHLALRSASSHGPYDLVVLLPNGGRALQCKSLAAEPSRWLVARWLAALPAVPAGWSGELWVKVAGRGWRRYDRATEASA